MPQIITEAVNLSAAPLAKSGRIRIKIIDAGQGSSGNYPAKTLEAAGKDKVFAKGLHMYLDHPSATEQFDRPERTIKDLAAVLTTDAVYESGALYAEAKVFPHYREVLTDPEVFEAIGVSIRASAEVDDSSGVRTITKLIHAESVDFVTRAGRGGQVMEVLESARNVREATANDTREWLNDAVKAAHGAEDTYVWARDFDDANVWFEVSGPEENHLYQQTYTLDGATVSLTGDPVEVRVETTYVPVAAPAAEAAKDSPSGPAGVTENEKEPTVATIQIEESVHADLIAKSSRTTALEAEVSTATDRAATAEAGLTEANDTAAAAIVTSALAEAGLAAPKTAARLSKGYPVKENGVLDAGALAADVAESIAELQVANGAGSVRALGHPATESADIAPSDILSALKGGK